MRKMDALEDQLSGRLRVAFLFILLVLIVPLFSAIFLLMDILGEGMYPGTARGNHEVVEVGGVLVLIIATFFVELVTMFSRTFVKAVVLEVLLLVILFVLICDFVSKIRIAPFVILALCTVIKSCFAFLMKSSDKNVLIQKRTGKIV